MRTCLADAGVAPERVPEAAIHLRRHPGEAGLVEQPFPVRPDEGAGHRDRRIVAHEPVHAQERGRPARNPVGEGVAMQGVDQPAQPGALLHPAEEADELPIVAMVGGVAAALLWRAADEPPLRASVARAGMGADGLAALIVLIWLVTGQLPDDVDALEAAHTLQGSGDAVYAEPTFVEHIGQRFVPTDPTYGMQWHLNNTGGSGGASGSDGAGGNDDGGGSGGASPETGTPTSPGARRRVGCGRHPKAQMHRPDAGPRRTRAAARRVAAAPPRPRVSGSTRPSERPRSRRRPRPRR